MFLPFSMSSNGLAFWISLRRSLNALVSCAEESCGIPMRCVSPLTCFAAYSWAVSWANLSRKVADMGFPFKSKVMNVRTSVMGSDFSSPMMGVLRVVTSFCLKSARGMGLPCAAFLRWI